MPIRAQGLFADQPRDRPLISQYRPTFCLFIAAMNRLKILASPAIHSLAPITLAKQGWIRAVYKSNFFFQIRKPNSREGYS